MLVGLLPLVGGCLGARTSDASPDADAAGVDGTEAPGADVAPMLAANPGFFDTGILLRAGDIGDSVWDLRVLSADAPPETYWQQRISSSGYGDSAGESSYVGPCDSGDGTAVNGQEIRLVGLYADDVDRAGDFGEASPDGAVPIWPPPVIAREATCAENQDTYLGYAVTVARFEWEAGPNLARIGDALCDASWWCATEASPAVLHFSCETPNDRIPTLHLDDLVVRCDGEEVARRDPTQEGVGAITADHLPGGGSGTWWLASPSIDPATLGARSCVLTTAGTVDLPSPVAGVPGRSTEVPASFWLVYPRITWTIPLSGASGPVCADAWLDLGGPITITYTSAPAIAGAHYDHVADPLEPR